MPHGGHVGFAGVAVFSPGGALEFEIAQGSPPGEPLVEAVPVADLVFADVPAEQDFLTLAEGGKVEQAAIEVFDQDAGGLDPLDAGGECRRRTLELRVCFREV